jgi:aromatic ring hydroxylase
VPKLEYATLIRLFGTQAVPRARAIFAEVLGGAPLVTPSSAADLRSEELRPVIDRFYRGSTGDAHDGSSCSSSSGTRSGPSSARANEWYEINYSGNQEQMRLDMLRFAGIRGITAAADDLVEQCLADYDLDGWIDRPWVDEAEG